VKVRAQPDHLGEPVDLDGMRSVVIQDSHGNPLIVAQEIEEGVTVIYTHKEPEFHRAVKALGIGLNTKYVEGKTRARA
jgi:hypothetical protein